MTPTIDPTMSPVTEPPVVTGNATTRQFTITINADFTETKAYLDANGVTLIEFATEVIAAAMHQDSTPSFRAVDIAVLDVRSGSIVIEYALTAEDAILSAANTKTMQSVGTSLILRLGDSWSTWALSDVVEQNIEGTTPAPIATPPPTKSPIYQVVTEKEDEGDDDPEQQSGGGGGGGDGPFLTTPILLVVLIGCCLLCVVIAVMVNKGCAKNEDSDGKHYKYASVAGLNNLYRNSSLFNRKSDKLSEDGIRLQHAINAPNGYDHDDQHGQHESDGPYPHSKAHHEEPPLPAMRHQPQTSTMESSTVSDGYSNPPSGRSQDSSSLRQPMPGGGTPSNRLSPNYHYNGAPQPQHGDYLGSTESDSVYESTTPSNSRMLTAATNAMNGYREEESHPAGTVMTAQGKYFQQKEPTPHRGQRKHHGVTNTTGTMEIKMAERRYGANQSGYQTTNLRTAMETQTTLVTSATTTDSTASRPSSRPTTTTDTTSDTVGQTENTTVIIHGGHFQPNATVSKHHMHSPIDVDTDSESTDSSDTESSNTDLEANSLNSLSSRPGKSRGVRSIRSHRGGPGRGGGGGGGGRFALIRGQETEHSDDEKMVMPPQQNAADGADGDVPYRNITNYQFSRLQSAIKTARTRSDFGKLKNIIANGQVPNRNWHGKGSGYNGGKKGKGGAAALPQPLHNGLAAITENQEMKGSSASSSENTDSLKLPNLGRFAGNGPRMNEDELAAKLQILSSGRRV